MAENLFIAAAFAALILLVAGCSTADRTKSIVVDIGREGMQENPAQQANLSPDAGQTPFIDANGTGGTGIVENGEPIAAEEPNKTENKTGGHIITIKDIKLDPKELKIKKGETVIWKHEDTSQEEGETKHYIVAYSNEFRTPIMKYGDTFSHTFNETGKFAYFDVIYKEKASMKGTIIVE